MDLHIESQMPALTPDQALTGWRREFCVELLGDGRARIFTRMVISPSHKAAELQHGVLFHRVGAAFRDLRSCMQAAAGPLRQLVASAVRQQPCRDNLFSAVVYDHQAWERVMEALDHWQRRPHAAARGVAAAPQGPRPALRQLPILSRRSLGAQPGAH
ncbi:hypothetical protein [Roseateles puraquae]|uniref:Uncharacterized protein n=1 Tax=Roseateles puraquae TaxID=431059 RepID=A0A254N708_9BURK|nr:hypothetical protein [Roseateles puraquae]MDG0853276.1 hypothetical protein [Roseateles puraquae]OWR03775.1 hypothetical protein CDO81_14960 [Roseateles puraquae]